MLEAPQLDDRQFQGIVDEAKTRLKYLNPHWTDHNVSDPGVTLIELFAWMTELLIYRLNRVPLRQYVTLLQLLGMQLRPAQAARTRIQFELTAPIYESNQARVIEAGTEIAALPAAGRPETVTFTVEQDTVIEPPGDPKISTCHLRSDGTAGTPQPQSAQPVAMFGSPPQAGGQSVGDAIYFGFERSIDGYTLQFDVTVADPPPTGQDPLSPPITWQAWDGAGWLRVVLPADSDTTAGLSGGGVFRLEVPLGLQKGTPSELPGAEARYYLRCVYTPRQVGATLSAYQLTPSITIRAIGAIGIKTGAIHALSAKREALGMSDGVPGQTFRLFNQPVLPFAAADSIEVEKSPASNDWEAWQIISDGDFSTSLEQDRHVAVEPLTGEVRFGPRIRHANTGAFQHGAVPPRGCRIRATYHYGGGAFGNLPAGSLTLLARTLAYVKPEVRQPEAASGGEDGERLEDLIKRAPAELRTGERAVTAQDYEHFALRSDKRVARAHCIPSSADGRIVEVLIIPSLALPTDRPIPEDQLRLPDDIKRKVHRELDTRRMVTTTVNVKAPEYIEIGVTIRAKLLDTRARDQRQVGEDILRRLYRFLNPLTGGSLTGGDGGGWEFGASVYASHVLVLLQRVPEVQYIEWVTFTYGPHATPVSNRDRSRESVSLGPGKMLCSGNHMVDWV